MAPPPPQIVNNLARDFSSPTQSLNTNSAVPLLSLGLDRATSSGKAKAKATVKSTAPAIAPATATTQSTTKATTTAVPPTEALPTTAPTSSTSTSPVNSPSHGVNPNLHQSVTTGEQYTDNITTNQSNINSLQKMNLPEEPNPPIRNTNLEEISNAVTTDCESTFQKSSFALKRTRSMGVFDASMRPNMANELVGSIEDYPHLANTPLGGQASSQNAVHNQYSQPTQPINSQPTHSQPTHSQPTHSQPAHSLHNHSHHSHIHSRPTPIQTQSETIITKSNPSTPIIGYAPSTTLKPEAASDHSIPPTLSTSSTSTIEDDGSYGSSSPSIPGTPELIAPPLDDSVIQYEPSRHVDYLSHNWKESDISSSWRYIVLRRKDMANSARLENASWRTWTKAKYNLKTVSPESVNWLKDYDVTWLYGPLYDEPHHTYSISPDNKTTIKKGINSKDNLKLEKPRSDKLSASAGGPATISSNTITSSTPTSSTTSASTSRNTSPPHPAKPILKKRSVSQMMLSRPPLIAHNSCNGTTTCNCNHHRNMNHEAANNHGDGVSTYLRHHNYRHRPHAGHSNENISQLINQQYYQTRAGGITDDYLASPSISGGDTSSISSISSGSNSTNVSGGTTLPVNPLTSHDSASSPPSKIRHIHFNDRVEQCIAVDHAFSDDEDGGAEDPANRGRTRQNAKHSASSAQGRPQFGLGIDEDTDDDSDNEEENEDGDYDYEEEEEEEDDDAGFFFMVRSASSVSLHNMPKDSLRTIALLPATTLKYQVDEAEREIRQQATANSVAFAMSHNTINHRHAYSTYDYNSVYVSPAPSPSHSPSHSLSASDILQATSSTSTPSTPVIPQPEKINVVGELVNDYPISTTVLLDSLPAVAGTSTTPTELPESEFIEDTSTHTHTSEPVLSLGLSPPATTKTGPTTLSSPIVATSSDASTPPSGNDENSATTILEDSNRPKIGRINSAVSSAKDLANSLWKSGWK